MTGAAWPGGPVTPPCSVTINAHRFTVAAAGGLAIIHAILAGPLGSLDRLLTAADAERLQELVRRKGSGRVTLMAANVLGVQLAGRLTGCGTGVEGWRKAVRLGLAVTREQPGGIGLITAAGIDPSSATAWAICGGVWNLLTSQPFAEDRDRQRVIRDLSDPIPGEGDAWWLTPGAKPPWLQDQAVSPRRRRFMQSRGPSRRVAVSAARRAASARAMQAFAEGS